MLFRSCSQLYFHKLSQHNNNMTINLYSYTLTALFSLIPTALFPKLLSFSVSGLNSPKTWLILLAISMLGISNQVFRSKAYHRIKQATYLAPMMYIAVIASATIGWFIFNEQLGLRNILGSIIIISSIIIMLFTQSNPNKRQLA